MWKPRSGTNCFGPPTGAGVPGSLPRRGSGSLQGSLDKGAVTDCEHCWGFHRCPEAEPAARLGKREDCQQRTKRPRLAAHGTSARAYKSPAGSCCSLACSGRGLRGNIHSGAERISPAAPLPITSLLARRQQRELQISSHRAVPTRLCPAPGQDWDTSHPRRDPASSALPRCAQGRRGHRVAAASASTAAGAGAVQSLSCYCSACCHPPRALGTTAIHHNTPHPDDNQTGPFNHFPQLVRTGFRH